mmetsp:Transcript_71221/g.170067  ORF Transcript_71221/g.170067 Transcript_71221/m.170067 type:complete len:101 (+) Transcript_71221:4447-4749(+)
MPWKLLFSWQLTVGFGMPLKWAIHIKRSSSFRCWSGDFGPPLLKGFRGRWRWCEYVVGFVRQRLGAKTTGPTRSKGKKATTRIDKTIMKRSSRVPKSLLQ